jgi:chitinase
MKMKVVRWTVAALVCGCSLACIVQSSELSLRKYPTDVDKVQKLAGESASKQIDSGIDPTAPASRSVRYERNPRDTNAKQLWIGAYIPCWNQERLDPKNDHFLDAITCFLHFAVYVRPGDGSLDLKANELTASKMRALVRSAHGAGKQVFLVVGGEKAAPGLRIASSPERLPKTLKFILSLVKRYGYDGIDIDWEPLAPEDADPYIRLIDGLRNKLDEVAPHRRGPKLGLTTAIEVELNNDDYMASLVRTLQKLHQKFDQINLMTYAMANSTNMPFVWHNSALYPGVSPEKGFQTPSADGAIRQFLAAGFQPAKLEIGIDLYGYLWQGQGSDDISSPGKLWKLPPKVVELTYGQIVNEYLKNNSARWDQQAEVPYFSIPQTNQFLSYEDSRGIEAKFRYVRQNGLGGVIIWDIGRDDQDEEAKRQLLDVINRDARGEVSRGYSQSFLVGDNN